MSQPLFAQYRFQLPVVCAGIVFSCAASWGQTHTATVRGTVTDGSGGIVRGAAVSLTNVDQRRQWSTRTGDAGEYVLVQIPPGNYKLTLEARGFKKHERDGLAFQVAQTVELDIRLETGGVSDTVTVTGETPLVEPGSSSL